MQLGTAQVTVNLRRGTYTVATTAAGTSEAARSDALFGEMTQRDPEFGAQLDSAEVARLTGLAPEDLDPAAAPQVVSTGNGFAIVVGTVAVNAMNDYSGSLALQTVGVRVRRPVSALVVTVIAFFLILWMHGGNTASRFENVLLFVGYSVFKKLEPGFADVA